MDNDFIEIYDNSASQELCKELVRWFDFCSDKNFTFHNMSVGETTIKTGEAITVPAHPPVSSFSLPNEVCNAYWEVLNKCLENYIEKYDLDDLGLSCHTFKLHKVKKSQGYHIWHCENSHEHPTLSRILAWMTYLKVPEEGGETEFLHQSKRIEPVIGKTLIWPAYFTHMHRGNPPLKGEKYYITGWFERRG